MKKIVFSSLLLLTATALLAQKETPREGPCKPPPAEERWKHDGDKLGPLELTAQQSAQARDIYFAFYKNMDGLMEKNKGHRPEKTAADQIIAQRNEALQKLLNKEQADRFKTIEHSLMPPPPPPGPRKKDTPPTT